MITMYDEIQKIIAPNTLSSFEYTKLEELKQTYTEEQIIYAYKTSKIKNINYIRKVLERKKPSPEWLHREIINEPLTEQDKKEHEDFIKFVEDFRNE